MQVKWVDPDTKEEIDTGLVRVKAQNQTAGGGAVDIGGGNEFGGAGEDEGADDCEETKLDQFWVRMQHIYLVRRGFHKSIPSSTSLTTELPLD